MVEKVVEQKILEVQSPFDRKKIAEIPMVSEKAVEGALSSARELFENRDAWLPAYERIAILERLWQIMDKQRDRLIETAVSEGGKPHKDTVVELDRAIGGVKLAAQAVQNLHGEHVVMGTTRASTNRAAWTSFEPIGPVVSLSAFNHPINLIVHQAITAVAAGCPVIVKPALDTPLSCIELVKLLQEAGLPERYCSSIVCSNELAERLATDPRVGYLSFIGSARVGWYLRSKLSPGTRCALEHGGVAPVIVDASADLDELIPAIAKGGFYHAGQVCVSVQRVYVPEELLGEVANRLSSVAATLKVGDPADPDTDVGPLIRPGEVDRVEAWVREAVEEGAELRHGGKRLSDTCLEPTVLVNPREASKISKEEVFGPVVCLYGYANLDSAIAKANSLPFAFQSAVFSRDLDRALYATQRLNSTAVMVNDHTAFRVDWMPFGGRDLSGLGMGGIQHSVKEMSREKLVVLKSKSLS